MCNKEKYVTSQINNSKSIEIVSFYDGLMTLLSFSNHKGKPINKLRKDYMDLCRTLYMRDMKLLTFHFILSYY